MMTKLSKEIHKPEQELSNPECQLQVSGFDAFTTLDTIAEGLQSLVQETCQMSFADTAQKNLMYNSITKHGGVRNLPSPMHYPSQQLFVRIPIIKPYEEPLFTFIQKGDLHRAEMVLRNDPQSIDSVDPYNLGVLYVRTPEKFAICIG